jgi:hypothetical protein
VERKAAAAPGVSPHKRNKEHTDASSGLAFRPHTCRSGIYSAADGAGGTSRRASPSWQAQLDRACPRGRLRVRTWRGGPDWRLRSWPAGLREPGVGCELAASFRCAGVLIGTSVHDGGPLPATRGNEVRGPAPIASTAPTRTILLRRLRQSPGRSWRDASQAMPAIAPGPRTGRGSPRRRRWDHP